MYLLSHSVVISRYTYMVSFNVCYPVCQGSLAQGGYFLKDDKYYCKKDYEILFGIKCKACGQYVEGRVVTALGNTYHPRCFTCDRCR